MFNFLKNLKINTRIILLSSAPILGLGVLGLVYLNGERNISAAFERAKQFQGIGENFENMSREVVRMRMLIRGFVLSSSDADIAGLQDAISKSSTAVSGTLAYDIDPAIADEVSKLTTLIPDYISQIREIERIHKKLGVAASDGMRGGINKTQSELTAFAGGKDATFPAGSAGADAIGVRIMDIVTLANSYRYTEMLGTTANRAQDGLEVKAADIKTFDTIESRKKEIDSLFVTYAIAPDIRNKILETIVDFVSNVKVWQGVDRDLDEATEKEEVMFGEINALLKPITQWRSRELEVNAQAIQSERDWTKTLALLTITGVIGFLLSTAFLVGRSIIAPIRAITGAFESVATGQQNIDIPSQGQRDEIGHMARILADFHKTSAQATRTQSALDVATSPFMLADNEGVVIAMNKSAQDMFSLAEADLKAIGPEFNAGAIVGGSLSMFGENLLSGDRNSSSNDRIVIGIRIFDLVLTPVLNVLSERLGTVV